MAVVVVAAADCGGSENGHLHVAVVLVVVAKFYLVLTWYQVKGFCPDAHRLTMKAISKGHCAFIGLTECIRFNKLKNPPPDTPPRLYYPFSRPDRGAYFGGVILNEAS